MNNITEQQKEKNIAIKYIKANLGDDFEFDDFDMFEVIRFHQELRSNVYLLSGCTEHGQPGIMFEKNWKGIKLEDIDDEYKSFLKSRENDFDKEYEMYENQINCNDIYSLYPTCFN